MHFYFPSYWVLELFCNQLLLIVRFSFLILVCIRYAFCSVLQLVIVFVPCNCCFFVSVLYTSIKKIRHKKNLLGFTCGNFMIKFYPQYYQDQGFNTHAKILKEWLIATTTTKKLKMEFGCKHPKKPFCFMFLVFAAKKVFP